MLDQRTRSLRLLARIQGLLGAVVCLIVFALYGLAPQTLTDTTFLLTAALLGAFAAVYFLTLHQIFKLSYLAPSTGVLTVLTITNLVLIITATGGLDSPFYAFWILAIVIAGVFGLMEILVIAGLTSAYYLTTLIEGGLHAQYFTDHLIQFGLTLAAAGLATWIHTRTRTATTASHKLEKLSGQLTTEQLKAEAIIQGIGEGVMMVDAQRRIQVFNRAAADLTGWDEASAQNIDYNLVMQLKTVDDKPMNDLTDPFIESWRKHTPVVRDNLTTTTRSGHRIQLSISVSPIFDDNDQPSGAIALFRDISKEKEVERQKDEFVSTASHEMRTPVAAIEGYISLAINPNVATIDDRAKKYLDKAHETIQHLGALFRDLLSVTKAEEGLLGGGIEPINLGDLVEKTVEDMQFTIQKKHLTLVYQIGGQSGKAIAPLYYVAANPERLREVLMNLIDNAGKFTSEGGIKVTLDGNDKDVTVGVSDSGIGIAPEDINHLFQKFYRIDNSATRTIGGTGLGLYLCRRIIESLGGRIWVTSKVGQGSTFRFTLPRLSQAELAKLQAAASSDSNIIKPQDPSVDSVTPPAAMPTPVPVASVRSQALPSTRRIV